MIKKKRDSAQITNIKNEKIIITLNLIFTGIKTSKITIINFCH